MNPILDDKRVAGRAILSSKHTEHMIIITTLLSRNNRFNRKRDVLVIQYASKYKHKSTK